MTRTDPPRRAPKDRLAALDGATRPALRGRRHPGAVPPSGEHPDPAFWGPELRRRGRARDRERPGGPGPRGRGAEWWDRLGGLRVELGVGVLVVALVAVVAGVVWYRVGSAGGDAGAGAPGPVEARERPGGTAADAGPGDGTGAARSTRRTGGTVVVHVAGAVATPGVLVMPAGARVIDAVEGAGGARPDADLDRLNLAARLVDGQRVLVLAVGAVAPPGDPGPAGGAGHSGPIDLNRATAAELESLPGIGPTLAAAILAERTRRGGFRSVNELREVRGIGEARFADIKDRVTV